MDFFVFFVRSISPLSILVNTRKCPVFLVGEELIFFQMEILMSCIISSDRRYHADLITRNKILKLDKKVECFQNSK